MKKAFVQLHLAVFIAGFTGLLGRLIHLNEAWLVWYRLLISAATMWILFSITKKIKRLSISDILKTFAIGCIACLHWVTFYGSIKFSNISVALVCFSSIAFFTAIIEPLLTSQKMNKTEVMLGLIVIAGIYIIFHFDASYKTGIILGLLSAALAAFFPVYNRQMMQRMNAQTLMTYELTGGFIFLSLIMPLYLKISPASYAIPTLIDWLWLLVLSWICSVWAFILGANALKKISAYTVNLTYNLEPLYGIALAFIFYDEGKDLKSGFYIGIALIAFAIGIHSYRLYAFSRKQKRLSIK